MTAAPVALLLLALLLYGLTVGCVGGHHDSQVTETERRSLVLSCACGRVSYFEARR